MIKLGNQKGVVLIIAYMVILVLMGLSIPLFMRVMNEAGLSRRQTGSLKAFYNAEKAISYAYFESADKGWMWFTHNWNEQGDLVAVTPSPTSLRTQGANADSYFITAGQDAGGYAANDGTFILKTFADPKVKNVTVVRAKGISGDIERVLEYRISRQAIFDFAWWTPYDLSIATMGNVVEVNGGRIHSNGNIYMPSSGDERAGWFYERRLRGVDTISTGKDKGIYYAGNTYYAPGYYDYYVDGSSNINGEVPIPGLGKRQSGQNSQQWAGTSSTDPYTTQYPWKYESGSWRYYGNEYAGYWPSRDWVNEEFFFAGSSDSRYNTIVDGKTLNKFNTWIYPAKKDAEGDIIFNPDGSVARESAEQIPAELEGAMWDWTKYNNYSSIYGSPPKALRFTVYDPSGTIKYVEDTRWKIITNPDATQSVVMTGLDDTQGDTYWNMLQRFDYWKALGYSNADAQMYSTHINPEVLDGTYGSEVPSGQRTIQVDNTNSMQQPEAWNSLLKATGLDDVIFANEQGEDMEPPRFATTYKEKSKSAGIYLSSSGGSHTLNYANGTQITYDAKQCGSVSPSDPDAYTKWLQCQEQAIDVLVDALSKAGDGGYLPEDQRCAKKVKFINTYTNKWNVVLEVDMKKMNDAGVFPANSMLYSEVPLRLSNAQQLPSSVDDPKKDTFNVIGEENIYIKGDYNNPASDLKWMPSAVISMKQIYTLSQDFNDPQVTPAFSNYPNYPFIYAKTEGSNLVELDPRAGGGSWVSVWNYPSSSDPNSLYQQASTLINAINADWNSTFNQNDPSGRNLYTVASSHPIINGETWGAMPNRIQQNHTYNCLMASYYNGNQGWSAGVPKGGIPYGVNLERWRNDAGTQMSKVLKGAYFQLDWGEEDDVDRFTAHQSDGPVDFYYYAPIDTTRAPSNIPGSPTYYTSMLNYQAPRLNNSYDSRFRNPLLAQTKPIFFGGGESSWREISVADF